MDGSFRPFILHFSDGRKLPVPHPDFNLIGNMVIINNEQDVAQSIEALRIVSPEEADHSRSG